MKTNIEVVRLALDYIEGNLQERLTFQSVAERFHYSPFFFDRLFQRITGMTITERIRERRLLRASSMLRGDRSAAAKLPATGRQEELACPRTPKGEGIRFIE